MDQWLESHDMWRKLTPAEDSLYRAVAEQVFSSQSLFLKVKRHVMAKLSVDPVQLELIHDDDIISCLCDIYKLKVVVYKQVGQPPEVISDSAYTNEVRLYQIGPKHYDIVYPSAFLKSVALCQSIIYELLYERVFLIDSPMSKSRDMICNKPLYRQFRLRSYSMPPQLERTSPSSDSDIDNSPPESYTPTKNEQRSPVFRNTPFPYKVAKAMMVDMYRNMEYDIWIESKNEEAAEEESSLFSRGDKCQVTYQDRVYNAHIQELSAGPEASASVFVEELGEKQTVHLSNLIALPQSHQQDSSGYRKRTKKKDLPLVVTVPYKDSSSASSHHIPVRPCSPGWRGRVRGSFGRRPQIINSAGHPIKNRWPMERNPGQHDEREGVVQMKDKCLLAKAPSTDDPAIVATVYTNPDQSSPNPAQPVMLQQHQLTHQQQPVAREGDAVPAGCEATSLTLDVNGGASMLPPPPPPALAPADMRGYNTNGACPAGAPPQHQPMYQQQFCQGYQPPPHTYPYMVVANEQESPVPPINYTAMPSTDPSGADLPFHDIPTLQFFYNYGLEYYRMSVPFMPVMPQPVSQTNYTSYPGPPPPNPVIYSNNSSAAEADPALAGAVYVGQTPNNLPATGSSLPLPPPPPHNPVPYPTVPPPARPSRIHLTHVVSPPHPPQVQTQPATTHPATPTA